MQSVTDIRWTRQKITGYNQSFFILVINACRFCLILFINIEKKKLKISNLLIWFFKFDGINIYLCQVVYFLE